MNNPYLAVIAVISGMGLIQGGFGLLNVLTPTLLTNAGYSPGMIGIQAALSSAGFLAGALAVSSFIRRIGHIRTFAALAAIDAVGVLAMTIAVDLWLWSVLRFMMSFGLSGIFTVCESWISSRTEPRMRGRVLAGYTLIYKFAAAAAPLVIYILPAPEQPEDVIYYFMIVSACFSLALLPVAFTHSSAPTVIQKNPKRLSMITVYKIAPAAVVAGVISSLSNSAVINLIPVYATLAGFGVGVSAIFFSSIQFGNMLLQWPAGWLSDKIDRRYTIFMLSIIVTIVSLIIAIFGASLGQTMLIILLVIWGGGAMSVYPICVAHASDNAKEEQIVELCSTLLLCVSIGMTVGPLISGQLIDWLGHDALFYYTAVLNAIMGAFVLWRTTRRRALVAALRNPFVNLVTSSLKLSTVHPRSPHHHHHRHHHRHDDE